MKQGALRERTRWMLESAAYLATSVSRNETPGVIRTLLEQHKQATQQLEELLEGIDMVEKQK